MNLALAGRPASFDVTFDAAGLNVAMSVFDDSGPTPVLVQGPLAMGSVIGYTYRGKFTPVSGKSYIIYKAVYTDGTFTTLHPDYSQGTETIYAIRSAPSEFSGEMDVSEELEGIVE